MKALAIIFASIFFVALIGFAVTAAITGFDNENGIQMGYYRGDITPYDLSETFEEQYDNIEIGIISSRVELKISPDDKTRVTYKNNSPNIEFICEVIEDTLVLREVWQWNSWFNFSITGGGNSSLEVEIPDKTYKKIRIDTTSGKVNANLPETETLITKTTSGSVMLSVSGVLHYDFSITSGSVSAIGLSGSGRVKTTSGKVQLDFERWDGETDINTTSGSVRLTVPRGSGAILNFKRTSGSLSYSLDGDEGRLTSSGTMQVGGDNKQEVNVSVTSGKVTVEN